MEISGWSKRLARSMRALSVCLLTAAAHADPAVVNVYNWGNSIGKDTVANFEKATGIHVVYQEFDSNETLQAKLLSGSSGYDVVVPSDAFWAKQLAAGIYQPLDKTKLPNYALLDPKLMALLAADDPGINTACHGVGARTVSASTSRKSRPRSARTPGSTASICYLIRRMRQNSKAAAFR